MCSRLLAFGCTGCVAAGSQRFFDAVWFIFRSGYVFDDHFDVFVEVAVRGAVIEKFSEIKHTSLTLTVRAREILQPYKL